MDLNISNEKLLEFDKEAIEEYKQKLLNEIAFSDLGEETRFIVRQLNKCNFLLTDPKARESSAKISEFIDSISTIITNNNSIEEKKNKKENGNLSLSYIEDKPKKKCC